MKSNALAVLETKDLPNRQLIILLLVISVSTGCVRRRLTVRSNPPGALVYIDGQEIGRTPVATPFTYYGTRNLRLVKDGFETISVNQQFPAPWYQVPPIDFVSENVVPNEIRDERIVDFELVPQANVSMDDVLIHAEQLRSQVRQAGPMMSVPVAPVEGAPESFDQGPAFEPLGEPELLPPPGA